MVSKANGRRKGPINGAANNKPFRRGYLFNKYENKKIYYFMQIAYVFLKTFLI